MKKLLLTILTLVSLASFAQKDLEVKMLLPENEQVIVNNTPFMIAFSVKNLGPDTIFPADSFLVGILLNFNPVASSSVGDTLAAGDSVIFSLNVPGLQIDEDDTALFCGAAQFLDSTIVDDPGNNLDCTAAFLRRFNTGVEEQQLLQSIKAYPNPANSYFTITMNAADASVEVLDITGKSVETTAVTMGEARMDVSNYKNGVYFYHIRNAAGSVVKSGKFTVSH